MTDLRCLNADSSVPLPGKTRFASAFAKSGATAAVSATRVLVNASSHGCARSGHFSSSPRPPRPPLFHALRSLNQRPRTKAETEAALIASTKPVNRTRERRGTSAKTLRSRPRGRALGKRTARKRAGWTRALPSVLLHGVEWPIHRASAMRRGSLR